MFNQTLERGDNHKPEMLRQLLASTDHKSAFRIFFASPRHMLANNRNPVTDICGVRFMTKSIKRMPCSVAQIAALMELLVEQLQQINRNLEGIREELRNQNIFASSGGHSPEGFAGIVHKLIKMHVGMNPGKMHKFFVWHPDTVWHPAFYDLIAREPLPDAFCCESDDLDLLCIAMSTFRQSMRYSPAGDAKGQVVFHLLIPAARNIKPPARVHFPDDVLPLRIVGPTYEGQALVGLNLPHAQHNLVLDRVENTAVETTALDIAIALVGFILLPAGMARTFSPTRVLGSNHFI